MLPGTYLAKRREAAGLSVPTVAAMLAALADRTPGARAVSPSGRAELELRLLRGEDGTQPFSLAQLELLGGCFRFDIDIYRALELRAAFAAMPLPQICGECGCSWMDACETPTGPCFWVSPELCSACADRLTEWPRQGPAPLAPLQGVSCHA